MKTSITKTAIMAIALMSIGVSANAQKRVTLGIKGGMNVSNATGSIGQTDERLGYNAGITADFALSRNVYVLTGVEFTTKGFDQDAEVIKSKVEAQYLQLPVHLGYAINVDNDTKVVFRAGPYVAYGIGGKAKAKAIGLKQDTFSDDNLKKFDAGVGGGVGIDYKHFAIGIGYDYGILDAAQSDDVSVHNSNAHISVGYKF